MAGREAQAQLFTQKKDAKKKRLDTNVQRCVVAKVNLFHFASHGFGVGIMNGMY